MYPQRYGETEIEVGDTVCDQYTGSCGRVVSIANDEVELEPTTIKREARGEYLEVTQPPIRARKANLVPNHIRRYEELGNPGPQIKHAAELWKNTVDGKVRRVHLCLWADGVITSCEAVLDVAGKEIEGSCYSSEPGQEEAFWSFEAHLTSPEVGYKIKGIEVENG